MTDAEIIKALECCSADKSTKYCLTCPLQDMGFVGECIPEKSKNALDLINRQKAEIERLKEVNEKLLIDFNGLSGVIKRAKAEAYKEFAERLKEMVTPFKYSFNNDIDNLLKELVGEDNA